MTDFFENELRQSLEHALESETSFADLGVNKEFLTKVLLSHIRNTENPNTSLQAIKTLMPLIGMTPEAETAKELTITFNYKLLKDRTQEEIEQRWNPECS